jgi:TldD protein
MNLCRRDFLRTTSLACGAAALPAWSWETDAAEAAAVDKHQLADLAIKQAKKAGATYADIRINRYRNESIFAREQRVQNVSRTRDFGFGVRVLLKGAWGFAASPIVTPESVRRITEEDRKSVV